jgi:hypothetical protein
MEFSPVTALGAVTQMIHHHQIVGGDVWVTEIAVKLELMMDVNRAIVTMKIAMAGIWQILHATIIATMKPLPRRRLMVGGDAQAMEVAVKLGLIMAALLAMIRIWIAIAGIQRRVIAAEIAINQQLHHLHHLRLIIALLKIAGGILAPAPQINAAEIMLVTVVVAQKLLGFVAQIKHIAQHH